MSERLFEFDFWMEDGKIITVCFEDYIKGTQQIEHASTNNGDGFAILETDNGIPVWIDMRRVTHIVASNSKNVTTEKIE